MTTPDSRRKTDLAPIIAHLCERGPVPPSKLMFQQLVDLDAVFPGVTVADFVRAAVIAVMTEGSA